MLSGKAEDDMRYIKFLRVYKYTYKWTKIKRKWKICVEMVRLWQLLNI